MPAGGRVPCGRRSERAPEVLAHGIEIERTVAQQQRELAYTIGDGPGRDGAVDHRVDGVESARERFPGRRDALAAYCNANRVVGLRTLAGVPAVPIHPC